MSPLAKMTRRASRSRGLKLAAATWLLGMQFAVPLLLLGAPPAHAQESGAGGVRVEPGTDQGIPRLLPGFEFLYKLATGPESTLTFFHMPPGTYDPQGPSPEAVASAIEAERIAGGADPTFKVLKVYSVVELDMSLYAVRYQTNQSLGITRNIVYDEVVAVKPDSGELGVGGMVFVDPIYAASWPDPNPGWRTAVGGIGAVAAAAAALAAAAASGGAAAGAAGAAAAGAAGASSGDNSDPNRTVGHVLQLNSRRIDVTPQKPALLEASIWKVHADGSYEPAPDCEIILGMPEGYSASIDRAVQSLSATISQGTGASSPSALAVYANGPASGTTETVEIVGEVESRIVWRLEPAEKLLTPNGRDSVTLIADVQLAPSLQTSVDIEAVHNSMTFSAGGEWGEVSEPVVWTDGGRAVSVIARSPQPDRTLTPPEHVPVAIAASAGELELAESAHVPLAALPELEVTPDEREFAQGCGMRFEFAAEVRHAGEAQWTFSAEWKERSPALGSLALEDEQPATCSVVLSEQPPENVNPRNPRTASTIVVKAVAEGYDDLERHIQVFSVREGLFADALTRHHSGRYHLKADGSAKPLNIGFRVYVADPATGEIVTSATELSGLRFEVNETQGSPAANAWSVARCEPTYTETRDTGRGPTGWYRLVTDERIPGKTTLLPVAIWVSVPGRDEEIFGYDLRIGLETPATAPGSKAWEEEYERCKKIIWDFAPPRYQVQLSELLERHARTFGAEGLYEMRRRIWFVAANLILAEGAEGYKEEEKWANRIYVVLDWSQWAGDIAFNVVAGYYLGPHGALVAGALKGALVSAIVAYREGRTPEQWLEEQLYMVAALAEGKVMDPDTFKHLSGASKAKCMAVYIAYQFSKELFYNKKSLVEAIKSVSLTLTEDFLGEWLGEKVRASGAGARPAGDSATIRQGDPSTMRQVEVARPVDTRPVDAARPDRTRPVDSTRPVDTQRPVEATRPADDASRRGDDLKPLPEDMDWEAEARKWIPPEEGATPADTTRPATDADAAGTTDDVPTTRPDDPGDIGEPKGPPERNKKPPEPKSAPPPMSDTARNVADHTYKGPDGRRYCDPETTLDIMRDPTRVRDLKNAPPEVQQAFENTRRAIYERHDSAVSDAVRHLPGMYGERVKVIEFRTPGGGDGLNTDRDFRVCYEGRDPVSGDKVWIEIPKEKWESASNRAFAEQTGGPLPADADNPTPAESEAMRRWAQNHQQMATDRSHIEASIDYSDQGYVVNPADGNVVRTQVTPNIEYVKRGMTTLKDADGLGRMFEGKVADAIEAGHPAEGFAQARKGVEALDAVRSGYDQQGYRVEDIPPNLRECMDAVSDAGRHSTDPAKVAHAEQVLREHNFKDLGSFMNKMRGHYQVLGTARKK